MSKSIHNYCKIIYVEIFLLKFVKYFIFSKASIIHNAIINTNSPIFCKVCKVDGDMFAIIVINQRIRKICKVDFFMPRNHRYISCHLKWKRIISSLKK